MDTNPYIQFIHRVCMSFSYNNYFDLEHDVILKLSNAKPTTENIKGYIYRTIKNTFLDSKRHETVIINYTRKETKQYIQTSLDCDLRYRVKRLPRELRRFIWLLTMGYKYEEISHITHKPIGTVKAKIHQARTMIKKSL